MDSCFEAETTLQEKTSGAQGPSTDQEEVIQGKILGD